LYFFYLLDEESYHGHQSAGEVGLSHWLTSSELLHTLTSSTSELMETLHQVRGKEKSELAQIVIYIQQRWR